MPDESNFRYFILKDEGLRLLRAYNTVLEELKSNNDAIQQEFQARIRLSMTEHQSRLQSIWRLMAIEAGLDPEETWGNKEYSIESRYLSDGFGAITFEPLPEGPMGFFGGQNGPGPGDDDLSGPPDGTTIN